MRRKEFLACCGAVCLGCGKCCRGRWGTEKCFAITRGTSPACTNDAAKQGFNCENSCLGIVKSYKGFFSNVLWNYSLSLLIVIDLKLTFIYVRRWCILNHFTASLLRLITILGLPFMLTSSLCLNFRIFFCSSAVLLHCMWLGYSVCIVIQSLYFWM